ncbi:MAG: 4Fe-4S binding protein [Methanobacterium sp.]|jgi:ferredoxin
MKYLIENCGCCGACVAVCSNKLLELNENEIIIREGCDNCGRCEIVCPLGAIIMEDSNEV